MLHIDCCLRSYGWYEKRSFIRKYNIWHRDRYPDIWLWKIQQLWINRRTNGWSDNRNQWNCLLFKRKRFTGTIFAEIQRWLGRKPDFGRTPKTEHLSRLLLLLPGVCPIYGKCNGSPGYFHEYLPDLCYRYKILSGFRL